EINIDDAQAETIGAMSAKDVAGSTNPQRYNAEQYQAIFLKALRGEL
ncbi:MAG: alcohol dehydrogenase, partial [Pseudomonadales bacterium]|nr:alcohol dehydrogenase [Pseudomonadales bacterium]